MPSIEVLGVYRLAVTEELVQDQTDELYGDDLPEDERAQGEAQVREQLASVVLVELLVRNRDSLFSADDFTQPMAGVPRESWQAAWCDSYLTPDGEELAVDLWESAPSVGDLRVAFFLHFWDPGTPLSTSYGPVECPGPTGMPERLARLVPFVPVD